MTKVYLLQLLIGAIIVNSHFDDWIKAASRKQRKRVKTPSA
jgi:hypothetical protein